MSKLKRKTSIDEINDKARAAIFWPMCDMIMEKFDQVATALKHMYENLTILGENPFENQIENGKPSINLWTGFKACLTDVVLSAAVNNKRPPEIIRSLHRWIVVNGSRTREDYFVLISENWQVKGNAGKSGTGTYLGHR